MLLALIGCSGKPPATLGLKDGLLSPCPDKPNCVASDATDEGHRIDPFRFTGNPIPVWTTLKDRVSQLPRTTIVTDTGSYLHAEAKSRLLGFVDDLEFHLRPDEGLIAIRSAARTGYSDFGVNAERIEALRSDLQGDGVLR